MSAVEVVVVESAADRKRFMSLTAAPYATDPVAAPLPPLFEAPRYTPTQNAYLNRGAVHLLLALRGGKPVARMSAHVDKYQHATHGDHAGFFGFFESVGDDEAAARMIDVGGAWLKAQGCKSYRGPFSYTLYGDLCPGFLVEGFDTPPFIGMMHNPPSYPALFERLGFARVKGMVAWRLLRTDFRKDTATKYMAAHPLPAEVRLRPIRKRLDEYRRLFAAYNEIWRENWQHLDYQDSDVLAFIKDANMWVDRATSLVCETRDGEVIAFMMTVVDAQRLLVGLKGKLTARALAEMLYRLGTKRWVGARNAISGLRKEYRGVRSGVNIAPYCTAAHATAVFERGFSELEYSWCLEDNVVNAFAAGLGAKKYKRFAVFERPIG
jgi:hypothetical protein